MIHQLVNEIIHLCLDSVETTGEGVSTTSITITNEQIAELAKKYVVSCPAYECEHPDYVCDHRKPSVIDPDEMTVGEFKDKKSNLEEHISKLISEFVEQNRGVADVSKVDVHIYSREIPADVDVEIQMTI